MFERCIVASFALIVQAFALPAAFADTLTVAKPGSGAGRVTSSGGTIDCGATCSNTYTNGTMLMLTATPAPNSQFTGWLGRCSGTGACAFTINGDTSVSATFATTAIGAPRLFIDGTASCDPLTDGLLVVRYQYGFTDGTLIGNAVGANATRKLAPEIESYLVDVAPMLDIDGDGRVDALTDGVLAIRYQSGLRGDALVANAVGAGATRSAAAIETHLQNLCLSPVALYTLNVAKTGNGSGVLGSAPAGIDCGAVCYLNYDGGTLVALSASANPGSSFGVWGGDCAGNGACSVTMDAAKAVTASFTIDTCVPKTCANFPNSCGQQSDGCGGLTTDCGTCTSPDTCGGGGVSGHCGGPLACTPKTCADFPGSCGPQNNGCGGLTASCGTCTAPSTCGGSGVAGHCGAPPTCTPKTCANFPPNTCGQQNDGCGGLTLNCGGCTAPNACGGGGVPGQCGSGTCVPQTCTTYTAVCGTFSNGCGGTVPCGNCNSPNTCGGGGAIGQCGTNNCTPKTCADYSASCGSWSNGCGGNVSCGTCTAPNTCGGGGVPGQCGGGVCTPKTCADYPASCGSWSDGCGSTISCGTCTPPAACSGGGIPGQCG